MESKWRLSLLLTGLALTSGCASWDATCTNCGTGEARVGIATTTPSSGNDYPVTYRVLIPDTDRRVRDAAPAPVKAR